MKKIFAIALALMLVMSMGTTAFADTVTVAPDQSNTGSTTIEIHAKSSTDLGTDVSVISVDIEYGSMNFVYAATSTQGVWNPADHTYGAATDTGIWEVENNSNYVTVTNHSNRAVDVNFTAAMDATAGAGITSTFDVNTDTLDAGVVDQYAAADSVTTYLTLDGAPAALTAAYQIVGTITVEIAESTAP